MRFTYSWLADFLDTGHDLSALADRLTCSSVEAEVLGARGDYPGFVVARVEAVTQHPAADKLSVCQVFDGNTQTQVVCGASNVREGMLTVFAKEGAVVPKNGMTIAKVKIRGVESFGMLCSCHELGLSSQEDAGIVELPESEYEVGEKFFPSEQAVEISVTPNRGDCLCVYGVARELGALSMGIVKPLPEVSIASSGKVTPVNVSMETEGIFVCRYITGIDNSRSVPRFIRERLVVAGIKTVSCVVDILNYVMLVLNRPMHVYDADKMNSSEMVVGKGWSGCFDALNGKSYNLCEEDIVIRDRLGQAQGLAGVIGGKLSSCTPETRNILLESAWYNPVDIALTSRRHKLSTDASYRFERFTDPSIVRYGLDLAAHMITQYCGGEVYDVVQFGNFEPEVIKIEFDPASVAVVGSIDISEDRICQILKSLGFSVSYLDNKATWIVVVPPWRSDVRRAYDLVEEVVRIHGYDKIIEQEMPASSGAVKLKDEAQGDQVRLAMLAAGLTEVVTLSFFGSSVAEKFAFDVGELRIENPISSQFDVMRMSLVPNLLRVAANNQSTGRASVAIFELGDIYTALDKSELVVCGVRSGNALPLNPHVPNRGFDFFDAKDDVLSLLAQFGFDDYDVEFRSSSLSYLHPYRSADVYVLDTYCGYIGEVHPDFIEYCELQYPAACFEIYMQKIPSKQKHKQAFVAGKYQTVCRDYAFVLDKEVKSSELVDIVRKVQHVVAVSVFDVYTGENVPEGKVSIAISVVMTTNVATMTESEIAEVSKNIIASVEEKLHGYVRVEET